MVEIEVKHLSKTFEQKGITVHALQDINLNIESGDIYGIIGMSGAGKSTLVRCLNYLERPTEGEVLIEGKDLGSLNEKELREQRSDIAMIFQHFNLLMQKSVLDNICFPLQIQGTKKKEARAKARELLKTVGLEEKEKAYPAQLSGGQKQRVAIARALAANPKILLCDEATSALDPQTTASILALLKQINEQFGITIVIITHQMSVIREICNRVAIIERGALVEDGSVTDIFNHPKSKAAKELILRDRPDTEADRKQDVLVGQLKSNRKIRIVFSDNSAFEPVIANMILKFETPVNILRADTKNVGGVAKGEMILGLPEDKHLQVDIEQYLTDCGLEIEEVTGDVEQ
ncbi:MAG: ATP-binding cassette domain-containing protein [Lachnospiraceae bacterium]|nr:ATP-binding cassette domain-containing protein [Lachnospiraceae bacterium]